MDTVGRNLPDCGRLKSLEILLADPVGIYLREAFRLFVNFSM